MKKGSRTKIGLIGLGNFGRFLYPYLKKNSSCVFVYDKKNGDDIKPAASCDIVIYSVPAQNLEQALLESREYIKKGALVMDVCSVKAKPCELMEKYLPETTEIIGTHPLFGPNSAKWSISGHNIVLCDVRTERIEEVAIYLEQKYRLNAIVTSPKEHDMQMAYVQGLTHLLAKVLNQIDTYRTQRTAAYDMLMKFKEILSHDSDALYNTIQKENPYAKIARDKFLEELIKEIESIGH